MYSLQHVLSEVTAFLPKYKKKNLEEELRCLLLIPEKSKATFYKQQIDKNRAQNKVLVESIMRNVEADEKVMILLRGLPGSGKSTKVEQLVASLRARGRGNPVVFSADHYFQTPSGYQYDVKKIGEAHNWAYKNAEAAALAFQSPILIDNTNTEEFEILNYYNLAYHNWYKFYVLEPDTEWAFDVKELARRTRHNVPVEKIARMLRRYCIPDNQKWVTNDSVGACAEQLQDSRIS